MTRTFICIIFYAIFDNHGELNPPEMSNNLKQLAKPSSKPECPLWEKYALTPEEAAIYFSLGVNKIRAICNSNKYAGFVLYSGNRILVKRVLFESYLDNLNSI